MSWTEIAGFVTGAVRCGAVSVWLMAGWYWWLRGGDRPGGPDRAAGGARLAVRSEPWIEVRGTQPPAPASTVCWSKR